MSREAMKLALDVLEYVNTQDNDRDFLWVSELELLDNAITALREALVEQPAPVQQEPVITARQLSLATRQWDYWKAYALELQERLVKYEGGSPMVLNTSPPTAEENT